MFGVFVKMSQSVTPVFARPTGSVVSADVTQMSRISTVLFVNTQILTCSEKSEGTNVFKLVLFGIIAPHAHLTGPTSGEILVPST